MKYIKLLRIPIVFAILISHEINPFRKLIDILPMIKLHLTDREKRYIINTCLHKNTSEVLQDMMFRTFDSIKELAGRILEEYIPLIDKLEPEYDYEPSRKYTFVQSLSRKYEVNYSRVTIYHRCRDRC